MYINIVLQESTEISWLNLISSVESSSGVGSNASDIRMLLKNSSVVHALSVLPTNIPVLRAPKDISQRILSKCADGDIRASLSLLTSEELFLRRHY